MRGRPFVLLGVNCDPDRAAARKQSANRGLNWRSWWDGGVAGPVAAAWEIEGLPHLVLVDQQGVVRHHNLHGRALEQAIEEMIRNNPAAPSAVRRQSPKEE